MMRGAVWGLAALLPLAAESALAQNSLLRPSLEAAPAARTMAQLPTVQRNPFYAPPPEQRPQETQQAPAMEAPPLRQSADGPPTYRMIKIADSEAPVIDGDLSDPVWQRAPAIKDFRQTEPLRDGPPTEPMEARMLYDKSNLYVSFYVYDSEPHLIIPPGMARDTKPGTGDFVRILIDPFKTRRNAYVFDVGPGGGRLEGLIQNNNDLIETWDTIWNVKTRIVADGWTVEIAIPFRSISYDPDATEWAFDFFRLIRRKTERYRWSTTSPSVRFSDISSAGLLTGIEGIDEGLGIDVQLYATGRVRHDRTGLEPRTSLSGSGSANLFYRITPSLTGTITVNPDFSDTPLDERQVNTSRFSLFLPETRDFFLQDATAFEFGGYAFTTAQNARPFFSRNIGLVNGVPVSILGGGKLSGNIGDMSIGALSVVTNEKLGTPRQVLSAARVVKPITDTMYVGVIATHGDPTGLTRNTLGGIDVRYFNPSWGGRDYTVQADVYYERSFSNLRGQGASFGAALHLPTEPLKLDFRAKQVDANFHPALGFANRTGIREYFADVLYRFRFQDFYLRWLDIISTNTVVTGLDNELQSRENALSVTVYTPSSDQVTLAARSYQEVVPVAFNLPGGVPVPAGNYSWINGGVHFETATARSYSLIADFLCCSFYDGNYFRADLAFTFRVGNYLNFGPRYVGTFIRLPTGDVDIHVLASDLTVNFTPDMQLALQAQFDTISENFGGALRYRWEYAPGDEIFASFVQSGLIPGTTFQPHVSQFAVRLGHTLRY